MSPITTHVLDTALGAPAEGVHILLDRVLEDGELERVSEGTTNADGRLPGLLLPGELHAGTYQMTFATGRYLADAGREHFYPKVDVRFVITQPQQHYHVPLLLSPFGYSTYRGS